VNREEFIRIRTDALVSFHTNPNFDSTLYLKACEEFYADGKVIEKEDSALMAMMPMATEQPPYRMQDLDKPSILSNLNLPDGYDDYVAGQRRFSTNYAEDWPKAHEENPFGKRHPLSWDNCVMPLLHGSQWGDPHFIEHLFEMIQEDEDGHNMLHAMQEMERRDIVPFEYEDLLGRPSESMMDLYQQDRNDRNSFLSDEEYREMKARQWGANVQQKGGMVAKNTSRLGLLSYLFGTEWQTPEQRHAFMELLKKMGQTEGEDSPEARRIANNFKADAGISWDRAKRNWFERMTPLSKWWERASHHHGPVSPEPVRQGLNHFKSPFVLNDEGGTEPSHTHHYWSPYQFWGGVGRDANSLVSALTQSYPTAFEGWLGEALMGYLTDRTHPLNDQDDSFHGSGSSFFPQTINHPVMQNHPHKSAIGSGWEAGSENPRVRSFNRRRGLWNTVANQQHLHPSEVAGSGKRMIIPSLALTQQPLGRIISSHSDMGMPRIGPTRERHPGDEQYHTYHNDHYEKMDANLGQVMQEMAKEVMQRYGSDVFSTNAPNENVLANTISRGNVQQLAQAANYYMMRGSNPNTRTLAPMVLGDGLAPKEVNVGPVHPTSEATTPPIYLSGDMDAWGHKMPATLAWKWDKDANGIRFDVKDKPFDSLQKTVHEGHLQMIDPTHADRPIAPKEKDAPALYVTNNMGHIPVISGDLFKADDYEPTGVFETPLVPAHTVYKLNDIDELRGFSGDWVVQKKPEGKRLFVEKKGSKITAKDKKGKEIKLPDIVKEGVREQMGDFVFDAFLKGKHLRAMDLLVHRGEDIHMDPLEDRLQILRTMYHTNDNISFPMPLDTKFTDKEGLLKNSEAIGGDLWIRDAQSTFAKGKEAHHLWVLYTPSQDGLTKGTTLPFVSNDGENILLEYPGHRSPLVVKGEWDGNAFNVISIEPDSPLARHAEKQIGVWGSVGVHLLKMGQRELSLYPPPFVTKDTFTFTRATLIEPNGEEDKVASILSHARSHIISADKAFSAESLIDKIKGLTENMLEQYGAEYGLERTEEGEWSVNEAIDDDTIETKQGTTLARISGSLSGGGWGGEMDMMTSPRGPTSLVDDEGIPMFDPNGMSDETPLNMPKHISVKRTDKVGNQIEGELDIEGGRAVFRVPRKTNVEQAEEKEVIVEQEGDDNQMPIM